MEELYSETYIKEAKLTPQKKIQRIGLIALAAILIVFGLLAAITMGTVLVLLVMVVAAGIAIFLCRQKNFRMNTFLWMDRLTLTAF